MIVTKKAMPRRRFLRGLGTTLALPLLDAMIPSMTALARTPASPATPSNSLPSGSPPVASTGRPSSTVRQRPTASKFSSEKPTGSISL